MANISVNLSKNSYETFLKTDATTDARMMVVAEHYGVRHKWRSYLETLIGKNTISYYS
jgi:hypothetical protein